MDYEKNSPFVLHEIINHLPYFIFWKDRDLVYQGANDLFAHSAGFASAADLVGKTDFDCCWKPEESEFFRKTDRSVMEKGESVLNLEEPQHQLDGSRRVLLTSKVPLKTAHGDVIGILGVYTDITDRIELEEVKDRALKELRELQSKLIYQEKMKSLGEMAGGIAHEINNPLTVIAGSASILKRAARKGEVPTDLLIKRCEVIEKTVERCHKIVNALRGFSRDGLGDKQENLTVDDLVSVTLTLCAEKIKSQSIEVSYEESLEQVTCQRIVIEQVLVNIVSNAIDALKEEKMRKIRIVTQSDADFVSICVFDSGQGIPEDLRTKVFEPFFTTKPLGEGTGLGLSMSRGMIEQNGGALNYTFDEQGSCFHIKLKKGEVE